MVILCVLPALSYANEPTKLVYHFNESKKIQLLVSSLHNVIAESPAPLDIKVVINGAGVSALMVGNTQASKQVSQLIAQGVHFGLCNNAIKKKNIKNQYLIEGVNIIRDGNIEIIELQKQGYLYIKI